MSIQAALILCVIGMSMMGIGMSFYLDRKTNHPIFLAMMVIGLIIAFVPMIFVCLGAV